MSHEKHIVEAIEILKSVGIPPAQHNERSALCLLAILNVKPDTLWGAAEAPLMGITPIMNWSRDNYGKNYAPNSRETFRKETMHQFIKGGIALYNPDDPGRPVNSPRAVYQVRPEFLALVKQYGNAEWPEKLAAYLAENQTLVEKYARARDQHLVPVTLPDGLILNLSPGAHSLLIKAIIEDFGARFAHGSKLLYVGDTGSKNGHFDIEAFANLGIQLDNHGKMPDVILYLEDKNWLYLIESVTSVGPVDGKRFDELEHLFGSSSADLVYVTALPSRRDLAKYIPTIAWETEVWVADSPTHLIHFNGDKFMGPHK